MSDERIMVFIDGSNFYHNLKTHHFDTKIDFKKFSNLLCGARKHVRTYYYNTPLKQGDDPGEYRRQQSLFDGLRRTLELELKLGYFLKMLLVSGFITCSSRAIMPLRRPRRNNS